MIYITSARAVPSLDAHILTTFQCIFQTYITHIYCSVIYMYMHIYSAIHYRRAYIFSLYLSHFYFADFAYLFIILHILLKYTYIYIQMLIFVRIFLYMYIHIPSYSAVAGVDSESVEEVG